MPTDSDRPTAPLFRRPLVRAFLVAAAVVVAGGWYAFRPDRLFTTTTVAEAAPVMSAPDAPSVTTAPSVMPMLSSLAGGRFHSNAHETVGTAALLDVGGGRRVLRLTDFRTSNGPDVRVVLVAAADVNDDATAVRAGYVELGRLKGTQGDQNYDVPASIDLAKYRTVTIWCERFDVNFGSAPLTPSMPAMPATPAGS